MSTRPEIGSPRDMLETRLLDVLTTYGGERIVAGPPMERLISDLADAIEAERSAGAAPLDVADLETLREALAIGSISWNGDGWYASELGYDYDAAEATLAAASAILARLSEGTDR